MRVFIRRALLVGRARARICLSIRAISSSFSDERRDERRKENVNETTIPEEKGKRKKKDRVVFSEWSFA